MIGLPEMNTSAVAAETMILDHDTGEATVRGPPSEVAVHRAVSVAPGAVPPVQLAPVVNSVPVAAFVIVAVAKAVGA